MNVSPSPWKLESLHGGGLFSFGGPSFERNYHELICHDKRSEAHANRKGEHGVQIVIFHSGDNILSLI